jgi:hypothetical protein
MRSPAHTPCARRTSSGDPIDRAPLAHRRDDTALADPGDHRRDSCPSPPNRITASPTRRQQHVARRTLGKLDDRAGRERRLAMEPRCRREGLIRHATILAVVLKARFHMAAQSRVCDFGWKAVDFDLPGVDDRRHTLASARGPHGLLVMFICNHCPYVKAIRARMSATAGVAGHGIA